MIDTVVIDDHAAVLAGIEAWFAGAVPTIRVVASGPDVSAAWTEPGRSARVVVLDLHLHGTEPAFSDLRRLAAAGRQVVVYSMRDDSATPLTCLELGAFTYLTKAEGKNHLVAAVHAAHENHAYVSPSVAGAMSVDRQPTRPALTPREIEVLLEWFQSESKELVAAKLGLSPRTVSSYLDRIRIKYANSGRPSPTKAALLSRALRDGLITMDDLE